MSVPISPDEEADFRSPAQQDIRLLPQSPDSEMGVICSLLLHPNEVMDICRETGVDDTKFHHPTLATIFTAIMDMREAGISIDFITLTEWLRKQDHLSEVGGAAFITELFTFVPTAANVRYYIQILLEKWTLRTTITSCENIVMQCYNDQDDVAAISAQAQATLLQLTSNHRSDTHETTMRDNLIAVQDQLEAIDAGIQMSGLMTGLDDLDEALGGLKDGEVTLVTGSTGGGKTSLVHNIIDHAAVDLGLSTMLFSFEIPRLTVTKRLICARAGINTKHMMSGRLTLDEARAYHKAFSELEKALIDIDDNIRLTIQKISARARRRMSKSGLHLVVLDYIQKIKGEGSKKNNSRQRDVAEVSDEAQKMAMELSVPVIMLAQINKTDGGAREAEDLEFDAKTILRIKRRDASIPVEEEPDIVDRDIVITKNSHGPLGKIPVTFQKRYVKFVNRVI